ncbi:MAG: hypothetical protein MJK18_03365, partial [Bdellovibrionales bacterium]|nr:hypothetical protein [Bdellovibrionales bacterium]
MQSKSLIGFFILFLSSVPFPLHAEGVLSDLMLMQEDSEEVIANFRNREERLRRQGRANEADKVAQQALLFEQQESLLQNNGSLTSQYESLGALEAARDRLRNQREGIQDNLVGLAAQEAAAADRGDPTAAARARTQIQALNHEAQALSADIRAYEGQMIVVRRQMEITSERIATLEGQIIRTQRTITELEQRQTEIETEVVEVRHETEVVERQRDEVQETADQLRGAQPHDQAQQQPT